MNIRLVFRFFYSLFFKMDGNEPGTINHGWRDKDSSATAL